MNNQEADKSWLERLSQALMAEPKSRDDLIDLLRSAEQRELLDIEALSIIEGALTVAEMQVREIMVPRAQAVTVKMDQNPEELLEVAISSGHSRFPVLGENPDDVMGILMAKDLLALAQKGKRAKFNLRDLLRPCSAIPESKRLNVLLQEFRSTRNHLAVVFDEYGGMSGIVTIEDVLEQIVGDIEDEYDHEEEAYIHQHDDKTYIVKALTPIEDFNEHFDTDFSDKEFDTIGGLVTNSFGHLPKRDEVTEVDGYQFKVLNADARQVHLLQIKLPE